MTFIPANFDAAQYELFTEPDSRMAEDAAAKINNIINCQLQTNITKCRTAAVGAATKMYREIERQITELGYDKVFGALDTEPRYMIRLAIARNIRKWTDMEDYEFDTNSF
jgi:hypothetical protein